jgi:hypothetical protein
MPAVVENISHLKITYYLKQSFCLSNFSSDKMHMICYAYSILQTGTKRIKQIGNINAKYLKSHVLN